MIPCTVRSTPEGLELRGRTTESTIVSFGSFSEGASLRHRFWSAPAEGLSLCRTMANTIPVRQSKLWKLSVYLNFVKGNMVEIWWNPGVDVTDKFFLVRNLHETALLTWDCLTGSAAGQKMSRTSFQTLCHSMSMARPLPP